MLHLASKSLIDHRERARALSEWERAFWWMGAACLSASLGLVCAGVVASGAVMALLCLAIGLVRRLFGWAIDREGRRLRDDLVAEVCGREEDRRLRDDLVAEVCGREEDES